MICQLFRIKTHSTVEEELRKEFKSMGVTIPHLAVDRAHRIAETFEVQKRRRSNRGYSQTASNSEIYFMTLPN